MKDQILKTNVTRAVESICKALRAHSGDSLVCTVTIISRCSGASKEEDENNLPDWYKTRVVPTEAIDQDDSIIDESAKIFYGHDHYGNEGILKVVTYKETPEEDEEEKGEEDGP